MDYPDPSLNLDSNLTLTLIPTLTRARTLTLTLTPGEGEGEDEAASALANFDYDQHLTLVVGPFAVNELFVYCPMHGLLLPVSDVPIVLKSVPPTALPSTSI